MAQDLWLSSILSSQQLSPLCPYIVIAQLNIFGLESLSLQAKRGFIHGKEMVAR